LSRDNNFQLNDFRHELKVPFQRLQYVEFNEWLQQSGLYPRKQFPDRQIHSVYLDSAALDDYQDNVSGISRRGKVRLRWYNDDRSNMVLELKNKRGRLANKLVIPLDNPAGETPFDRDSVNRLLRTNERSWSVVREYSVFPSLHAQYERSYYEIAPRIRMTLDRHIRYQKLYPVKAHHIAKSVVDVVVEFKYPTSEARRASQLLAGMPGRVFRHSKYVVGVDTVCDL
jgi:SPX domain protein involved in polyphosphate accumulation